jgi:hypothetical protein
MPISNKHTSKNAFTGVLTNSLSRGGELLLAETVEMLGYKDTKAQTRLNYKNAKILLNNDRNNTNIENKIVISPYSPWYFKPSVFKKWLTAFPSGQGISVHIPQTQVLAPLLEELNYRHILIMRDPRALLASILFIDELPLYFLHADFETLTSNQRLKFIAEGGYAEKAQATVISFAEVYRSMLAWKDSPDCLMVFYEDLVGDLGFQQQKQALTNIADYLNTSFDNAIFEQLNRENSSWKQHYKANQLKEWENIMGLENLDYIMNYCQLLCHEAGYK